MLKPSLEEVKALAKQYNTIPVFYEFSADNQTPLNIYAALSKDSRNSFILESVSNGVQWDRYSFVGVSPKEEICITGNTAEIRTGDKIETKEVEQPIAFLKERMAAYRSPVLEGAPNFTGGLIGYFGYDTVRYMEKKLTHVPEDDIHMPDCHLFLYEELLAYDHLTSNGIVILNLHTDGDLGAQYAAAQWRAEGTGRLVRHYNLQPAGTAASRRGCGTLQPHQGTVQPDGTGRKGVYPERRYFPDRAFPAVRDQQSAGQLFRLPETPCHEPVTVSVLFPHTGI